MSKNDYNQNQNQNQENKAKNASENAQKKQKKNSRREPAPTRKDSNSKGIAERGGPGRTPRPFRCGRV